MHVGFAPIFRNPTNALSDAEVYRQEVRLAEPLGFDSVWSIERRFNGLHYVSKVTVQM